MRLYGKWAGNERGQRENLVRCVVSISQHDGFRYAQCSRLRGHGPEGLYCKQHGRIAEEGRYLYVPVDEAEVAHG